MFNVFVVVHLMIVFDLSKFLFIIFIFNFKLLEAGVSRYIDRIISMSIVLKMSSDIFKWIGCFI